MNRCRNCESYRPSMEYRESSYCLNNLCNKARLSIYKKIEGDSDFKARVSIAK